MTRLGNEYQGEARLYGIVRFRDGQLIVVVLRMNYRRKYDLEKLIYRTVGGLLLFCFLILSLFFSNKRSANSIVGISHPAHFYRKRYWFDIRENVARENNNFLALLTLL